MVEESSADAPKGAVPLSAAVAALRNELVHAVWAGQFPYDLDGQRRWLRFKPAAVEVTLQVAVTTSGKASAGLKWWLVEAGGELSREKVATQTVKLTLEPALFDETGKQVELLIDAADDTGGWSTGNGEQPLDAPD